MEMVGEREEKDVGTNKATLQVLKDVSDKDRETGCHLCLSSTQWDACVPLCSISGGKGSLYSRAHSCLEASPLRG